MEPVTLLVVGAGSRGAGYAQYAAERARRNGMVEDVG